MAQIELHRVSYTYPLAEEHAVSNISLTIEEGDFVLLCGMTGSGKSTLLRLMKKGLCDAGVREGEIYYNGERLEELPDRRAVCEVGFVFQDADSQIVMDTVWHELAFSLENLALPQNVMRARIAEMAAFFGLEAMMQKPVCELSGGEKKLLCLASVLILRPRVLLLDEPITALDPIAARDFIGMIERIHRELGTTIVLTEHCLAEILPLVTKMVYLERGEIRESGRADAVCRTIAASVPALLPDIPALFFREPFGDRMPLDVLSARKYLQNMRFTVKEKRQEPVGETVLSAQGIDFFYPTRERAVLHGLELFLQRGECLAILGGNGAGKSTLLKIIARILQQQHGKMLLHGKKAQSYAKNEFYRRVGYLAQNPRLYFTRDTVQDELLQAQKEVCASNPVVEEMIEQFRLRPLLARHPSELSGGQQELLALALVLLAQPEILLLDEPTSGLDAIAKDTLRKVLAAQRTCGVSIVFVTHDMEFAARAATRCVMLFGGEITASAPPRDFFTEHYFYTTPLRRALRERAPGALCAEDLERCEK